MHDLTFAAAGPSHGVQFYENEDFLAAAVADYLAAGFTVGQSLIVIATPERRRAIATSLRRERLNVKAAAKSGQLTWLDARDTLDTFMVKGEPDGARFDAVVGSLVRAIAGHGRHPVVRLYGEMVDVLWRDGNTDGALRLETFWNDLALTTPFSLLCTYAMGGFFRGNEAQQFVEVCRHHTHVLPAQGASAVEEHQEIEIGQLQERARALEAEVAQRRELEERLREALASRMRAEESLRQHERELRTLLEERDQLLERERTARSDAEKANRAKSEFLAVMSHELRTPLNAIAGHLQLIELGIYGPVTRQQASALHRVQRSQRHLLSLITDVLNLSRIETGRLEFRIEEIPLAPLLDEIGATLEPLVKAKELTYRIEASGVGEAEPLVARADRERLHQIVLNLITNAIKFTPPGGTITLATSTDVRSGMHALTLRDTGIGIPVDKVDAVFEPFVQLGRSSGAHAEGVGLGLAISRDLARGMGGDLTASSILGEGSTFVLTLPVAAQPV